MSKLMLIDAAHPEETRVTVVADGQIEDFDFEARDKRQLRGNIYLAKVTRVEPSLQAAFVEYGGNRHGFLAFSEIHPDYYQIPQEDRDALLAEEMASARHHDDDDDESDETTDSDDNSSDNSDDETNENTSEKEQSAEFNGDETVNSNSDEDSSEADEDTNSADDDDQDDAVSERPRRPSRPSRRYKIQEVIKRRQVLLIQVVKEERGNKGAAVTTYLSLAGRYGVLMPNTARGGGISRKISNSSDRKRLKKIMGEFDVPQGMGLIIRTAGAKRTKSEISRDYEYLIRLWSNIRNLTLDSTAPCLIHEEGDLVLRAIRDLYDRDIDRIIVEGKDAYMQAKNVISMLMPDHAKKVVEHKEKTPLFISQGIEPQLDNIFSPVVQLPSGGYLVINQTEALVAVDVNSGKATRERSIETTALKTNLEAAAEVCRQMRLRDLAGLVVIDFIDMEETKNNRAVEKKMKDCLSIDRARVQTGRISQFGLFEISRQRRRAGVLELSSEPCKSCSGTGRTRSIESSALQLLRAIEERAADERVDSVAVSAPAEVALYILNHKRESITAMEESTNAHILIRADDELMPGDFAIEATGDGKVIAYKPIVPTDATPKKRRRKAQQDDDTDLNDENEDEANASDNTDEDDAGEDGSRRRRRGRRGGRRRRGSEQNTDGLEVIDAEANDDDTQSEDTKSRSKRGRRRRPRRRTPDVAMDGGEMMDAIASAPFLEPPVEDDEEDIANDNHEQSKTDDHAQSGQDQQDRPKNNRRRRRRRKPHTDQNAESTSSTSDETVQSAEEVETVEKDLPKSEPIQVEKPVDEPVVESVSSETTSESEPESQDATTTDQEETEISADSTIAANDTVAAPDTTTASKTEVIEATPAETPADVSPEPDTQEETATLHSLHADAPKPDAEDQPKKRRIGWWNRK